ncbi:hypothetical protein H6F43_03500 [Leptolyngbya sp. FACHB-36]|uniref:hypothetical protein n=1 Tax=Leptolyngbya sp. FACHB-36 TaxID=2692808 RepID=UPI0016819C5D|nr:hypothetical protein [Leptolyngbya sp. FACHB-36]MBD2019247.1 hypothetical protein [Leptolyngbya sp. FACHB-36]
MLFPFPSGSWCRPAQFGSGVVLWVPLSSPAAVAGLGSSLRALGARLLEPGFPCDSGVALHLGCPAWLRASLLSQLPRPRSAGSRTPGVLLPR